MSRGSSSGEGFGAGRGKGVRKGPPIVWEGPLGPDFYPEPVLASVVQMMAEGADGGHCFFKCPRAWVTLTNVCFLHVS